MNKLKKQSRFARANLQLFFTVVPVVLVMILIFFTLARTEIINLSKDKLALESKSYASDISNWAQQVLDELNIYQVMIEQMGLEENTFEMLKTSSGTHDAYPYGLYWGDENGTYFDSSGWIPGDDFVVTERDWYKEGLENSKFAFGEPYIDAMTGDTCVSATVRLDGETVSVLAADVYLDYASQVVAQITEGKIEHALFVTGDGRVVVADSNASMVGVSLRDEQNPILYKNINKLLDEGVIGQSETNSDNKMYYIDINVIENTDWYFVTCMSRDDALSDLGRIEIIMIAVATAACIVLILVTTKTSHDMSKIKHEARTDPLTKLLNRDGFREMVSMALETHPNQGMLLILDLDNFKLINDQLGHPEGDAVLKRYAGLLEEFFNRNKDIVARIGGDEFAIFVGRAITAEDAETLLGSFISVFHDTFDEKYHAQKLSVSLGGSFVKKDISYDNLYRIADDALYQVKKNGKNGFKIL